MGPARNLPNDLAGMDKASVSFGDDHVVDQCALLAGGACHVTVGGPDEFQPEAVEDAGSFQLIRGDVPVAGGDDAASAEVGGLGNAADIIQVEVFEPESALAVDVRQEDRLRPAL